MKLYNGEVTKLFLMNGLYMLYFQRLFFNMAKKSGFDYEIHDNFETSAGIVKIIDKHSSQPSTIKIKELNDPLFSLIKMKIVYPSCNSTYHSISKCSDLYYMVISGDLVYSLMCGIYLFFEDKICVPIVICWPIWTQIASPYSILLEPH